MRHEVVKRASECPYGNTLEALVHWACDVAEVPFDVVRPKDVTVVWEDGSVTTGEDNGTEATMLVMSVAIKHPEIEGVINVQVGKRN